MAKVPNYPSYSELRELSNLIKTKYSRKERRAHVFEQTLELLRLWIEKPNNTHDPPLHICVMKRLTRTSASLENSNPSLYFENGRFER